MLFRKKTVLCHVSDLKQTGVGCPLFQAPSLSVAHLQPLPLILPSIQHICCVENSHCLIALEAATAVYGRDERQQGKKIGKDGRETKGWEQTVGGIKELKRGKEGQRGRK